jgi:hypothetical protein
MASQKWESKSLDFGIRKKESKNGISEIRGKGAMGASSERWQRASFKQGKGAKGFLRSCFPY